MLQNKNIFKFTEKCLFDYKRNCAKLSVLTEDLRVLRISGDVHARQYETSLGKSCLHSDPVFSHFQNVERLEQKIEQIKRITEPVKKLRQDLKKNKNFSLRKKTMLKILELYFFKGCTADDTAKKINVCRSVFFSTKKILVKTAGDYLGFNF